MAKRAEVFHRREQDLHEIVADYFDASEHAEKTRAAAKHNAEKVRSHAEGRITAIHEQAENEANEYDHHADMAIGRMLEFGESPKAIASTLGIPFTRIREIQRRTLEPGKITPGTR